MRSWVVCTLLSASLLVGQPAFADKVSSKERLARKACLSGDYAKGVGLLTDLFLETNDANYLYNAGLCFERNARYVEAVERFKEYRRKEPKLGSADTADVDKHIASCEAAAAKGQTKNRTSPEPIQPAATHQPAPAAPPVAHAEPATTPPVTALTSHPKAAPAPSVAEHPWQHTAKWVATGAAVAFLGFGVLEHATYWRKNTDYNKTDCDSDPSGCQSLADKADRAQILAIIGYGAAAVATGAAITFWLTDSPKAAPAQHAGIGFSCAPLVNGVSCRGHF
jgi:hypothetical protein